MVLSELRPGQSGLIRRVGGSGAFRRRLLDLGLLPGEEITAERLAPFGSPIEFKIRDYHLALRPLDAGRIQIELLYEESSS